jgi:hypothetical protein
VIRRSRRTYEDGSICVVVESGMPQDAVRIGVGDTWREAVDSLETTAIQSTGRDCGVAAALRWAASQDWISSAELDEVDVDLDEVRS